SASCGGSFTTTESGREKGLHGPDLAHTLLHSKLCRCSAGHRYATSQCRRRGRKRKVHTMTIPTLRLNDGHTMPQIGLGTASLNDDTVAPVIEIGRAHV